MNRRRVLLAVILSGCGPSGPLPGEPLQTRPVDECLSLAPPPRGRPDSTDLLQARIDNHQPLPAGTYYISRDLQLRSNTTVRGAGMESTCIRAMPGTSVRELLASPHPANRDLNAFSGIDLKNVGLQDLTIVMTRNGGSGVLIKYVTRARLENLRIVDAGAKGINFYGAKQVMLRGIRIEGTRDSYGIGFEYGAHQNVILSDIEIFNPGFDGIDVKNRCWKDTAHALDNDGVPNQEDNCPQDDNEIVPPHTTQDVTASCAKDRCPADGSANFGFQLDNIRIRHPGANGVRPEKNPPTGIEVRSRAILSNIYVDHLPAGLPAVRIRPDLGADRVVIDGLHVSGEGVGIWVADGGWAEFSVVVAAAQFLTGRTPHCLVTPSRSDPVPPIAPALPWCP